MAKTLNFTDPIKKKAYTLEFNRRSVEMLEKRGFVAAEAFEKPATYLPMLFAGAFYKNHRTLRGDEIEALYDRMTNKEKLIVALVEMYQESVSTLMDEPDEGDEGKLDWTLSE